MNYDRLLTRVWDKEKRMMIYPHDQIKTNCDSDNYHKRYLGISINTDKEIGLSCIVDDDTGRYPVWDAIGDRYVPMMCSGDMDKSKEKKLIYESDIVTNTYTDKDSGKQYNLPAIVQFDKSNSGLILNPIVAEDYWIFKYCLFSSCEIIGNKWENPELLEQDEGA